MKKPSEPVEAATLCAHAGQPHRTTEPRPHVMPLYQVSVFEFPSIAASVPALTGEEGYAYCRNGLPNADELGQAVAALEGAEAGVAASSGMGAITAAVLALAAAGDRVVVQRDAYGGSVALFERDLARLGLTVIAADPADLDAFARALDGAAVALVETISNPLLRVCKVDAIGELCRRRGVKLICDNTFATPLRNRPLAEGADLVVHSVTKFLGGHSDVCAGVVVGAADLVGEEIRALITRMGLGAAPLDAWLALRGLRTLELRMTRAWATAAELAQRLARHPAVRAVYAAERCALVSLDLGELASASRFIERLGLISLSPSLGGVTTTASHSASSSHRNLAPQARAAAGIGDGLVRLSIGIEAVGDLWRDIEAALGFALGSAPAR